MKSVNWLQISQTLFRKTRYRKLLLKNKGKILYKPTLVGTHCIVYISYILVKNWVITARTYISHFFSLVVAWLISLKLHGKWLGFLYALCASFSSSAVVSTHVRSKGKQTRNTLHGSLWIFYGFFSAYWKSWFHIEILSIICRTNVTKNHKKSQHCFSCMSK